MSLLTEFIYYTTNGWNVTSISACIACICMCQVSGLLWYGPWFGQAFLRLAHPHGKTPEDLKRKKERKKDDFTCAGNAYASAMVGSALAVILLRTLLIVLKVGNAMDGVFVGVLLSGVDTVFGIMHPFFEDRPIALYFIHQGYHLWCLSIAGGILGFANYIENARMSSIIYFL